MDHDHMTMTMDMSSTGTLTGTAAAATSTGMDDMHSMHGMGNGCNISMLWNWNTIDTCFLSSSWHIRSSGMFAGSCIGVILLAMSLEFMRRAVKEYDRYLIRKHAARPSPAVSIDNGEAGSPKGASPTNTTTPLQCAVPPQGFRPTIFEQAIRAFLHMVQFAVAYFVMLLAMYYNGYIIICIFIGAYIGAFIFQWETLGASGPSTSASKEATVCCG